jgi:ATP-dependent DNA helicase RecG
VLEANISTAVDVTGDRREIRRPDYPIVALQQLTRNALLHRNYESSNSPVRVYWYEDRIEILSPGGPFGRVNLENIGQSGVTDYRNPQIAAAMRALGYVQRFGLGFPLARKELKKNGNPDLVLEANHDAVLVSLRKAP